MPTQAEIRAEQRRRQRQFLAARKGGRTYARQLAGVAKQVGAIVNGFAPNGKVRNPHALQAALDKYADLLRPWAVEVSSRMITMSNLQDIGMWKKASQQQGNALQREILTAPTGQVMQLLLHENVDLITSLPTKAAERVHKLTTEALYATSERAASIADEIMASGRVTHSRAMLIARTEVARTSSLLTQSRAEYVGSTHYIWRTVGDSDVRPLHQKMEGKVIAWNNPPKMEPSLGHYHAGQGPNCRCYPEPILPAVIR